VSVLSKVSVVVAGSLLTAQIAAAQSYTVVDTGQTNTYDGFGEIPAPDPNEPFYGQDAQYDGTLFAFQDNGNGTVSDLSTGLMWQQTPDLNNKSTYAEAIAGADTFNLAGYDDWRLPTIKELYSLIDFNGSSFTRTPYVDTDYFDFRFGDPNSGERVIADGRIKGYPRDTGPGGLPMTEFVRYVRGNPSYGVNHFVGNADGTITDLATGLMWQRGDSGEGLNWEEALAYCENLTLDGYDEWRLPNAKELQSIVDYTRAPDATDPNRQGPALDPIFEITSDDSFFWTSTTHLDGLIPDFAVYVCFGEAWGWMEVPPQSGHYVLQNVHGAGAQRSDPKSGDPNDYPFGNGPQGDLVRIDNYVRCVRDFGAALCGDGFLDPGEQCDDGNTDPGDGCDENCQLEAGECPATPLAGCSRPGKSMLMIKDRGEDGAGANDKLVWKWLNGPATTQGGFGDPVNTTDYRLCLYTGSTPAPVMEVNVPAAANWRALSTKGYKYMDRSKAVDGIFKIMLRAGGAGQSKAMILGRDGNLPLPELPLDISAEMTAQLSNSDNGNCWEERFTPENVTKNTNGLFKAKTP
jgi:cysteine-rich repeat protein